MAASRIKIMTWNIWWRFGPHWQDRQAGLVQTLRHVDADVVALQEVWGSVTTTQAYEFANQLGMHAGFVAPSYPPISDVPRAPEDDQILLGLGLLSRWPISKLQQVELPARHRSFGPVAMVATLGPPCGTIARDHRVPGVRARLQR
jgi:endonuclease/exonuclease/phosphatase family metal-dependent hydrolase